MSNTLESLVKELQNRIGQLTSQYEIQVALLKIQANEALQEKDAEIEQLKSDKLYTQSNKKEK